MDILLDNKVKISTLKKEIFTKIAKYDNPYELLKDLQKFRKQRYYEFVIAK